MHEFEESEKFDAAVKVYFTTLLEARTFVDAVKGTVELVEHFYLLAARLEEG
jgi:hypothetical protein